MMARGMREGKLTNVPALQAAEEGEDWGDEEIAEEGARSPP